MTISSCVFLYQQGKLSQEFLKTSLVACSFLNQSKQEKNRLTATDSDQSRLFLYHIGDRQTTPQNGSHSSKEEGRNSYWVGASPLVSVSSLKGLGEWRVMSYLHSEKITSYKVENR